ncbi:valine--pyruvate transaminase [Treponema sp.]
MNLSLFGEKYTRKTGILELMEDLALASKHASSKLATETQATATKLCMLGGGNPAGIPELEAVWRTRMGALLDDEEGFARLLGTYDSADGNEGFRTSLAALFTKEYGWDLGPENICVTNGSQIAVWYLLNLFSGIHSDGHKRRILFPLMPEYVGYADQGILDDVFVSCKPRIELRGENFFKYFIDFDAIEKLLKEEASSLGAICVSRPTNPSGNVLTDEEIQRLSSLAKKYQIPLIVDNAYGLPFPGIVFSDAKPFWDESTILTMSLSKLGLPSARTGIVIARKEIITALSSVNAIASLATGTVGQAIVAPLIQNGSILELSRTIIQPFYKEKRHLALDLIQGLFSGLPLRVHESEGAIFLWLWFQNLRVESRVLYEKAKARNVLVLPGEYFSFGRFSDGSSCSGWDHTRRCIRINYSGSQNQIEEGLSILSEVALAST